MKTAQSTAPRAGRSVEGMIAPLRPYVFRAVDAIDDEGADAAWLLKGSQRDTVPESLGNRFRWGVVAITLIDMIRSASAPDVNRALAWFGLRCDGRRYAQRVEEALGHLVGVAELSELLPYLLDIYGRTSRLDVMRNEALSENRAARKAAGSFYTPVDVADFMVTSIASKPSDDAFEAEWWMDPACGSGVFLAAALKLRMQHNAERAIEFATSKLTGYDISPQACDFAAFVILSQLAHHTQFPIDTWETIRRNIAARDATTNAFSPSKLGLRASVGVEGPLRLICNPPYAVSSSEAPTFLDGQPTKSLYLPFVEMTWRVANCPDDAAVVVVPLSLAFNRSADHRRCRSAMAREGGEWTLLFFDRQPHALFGEEAKTRAAIAIRRPGPIPAEIRTSGLLKWTSRQRTAIFSERRAVSIGQTKIGRLIPKLGSSKEVDLYSALDGLRLQTTGRPHPTKANADEIVGSQLNADVFMAGTAYNFLNVFRNYPDQLSWRGTLSASGIHRLQCATMEEADAVTAILSARLTFWLWHVECDGFHVPTWFLTELPLLNLRLSPRVQHQLAILGREVWTGLQKDILTSVNGGRLTFAFRPTHVAEVRTEIDRLLLREVECCDSHVDMLRDFEQRVVSIDGSTRLASKRREIPL